VPNHFLVQLRSPSTGKEWKEAHQAKDGTLLHDLGLSGPLIEVSALKSIQIHAKLLTGKTVELTLWEGAKIDDIKHAIFDADGTPVGQQRMLFEGQILENGNSIDTYGIQSQDTVHLVLGMRGGMFHETSGRHDFEILRTISRNKARYSIRLLLPGNCEKIVTVNGGDKVSALKEKAIAFYNQEAAQQQQNNSDHASAALDADIESLRSELRAAELEKERIVCAQQSPK